MASLNHVCMWEGHGWKRITAEEAAKRYPYGTIHADSGLFMCELCGQYVSLTNGSIRVRYFKHSRAEDEKTCPERTFGPGAYPTYSSTDHDLPIRICVSGNPPSSFSLEMGLVRVPENLLEKNFKLTIYPKGDSITTASCIFLYGIIHMRLIRFISKTGAMSYINSGHQWSKALIREERYLIKPLVECSPMMLMWKLERNTIC